MSEDSHSMPGIAVVAPSSVIPEIELNLAAERLAEVGFPVFVHPQCWSQYRFFAGKDEERAKAFWDAARVPELPIIWCARGGYGAARILPLLEKWERKFGKPPQDKLLVGYSDATALMEFVRRRWGWSTLHGPMLSLKEFTLLKKSEWNPLIDFLIGQGHGLTWFKKNLKPIGSGLKRTLQGEVVGGNLSVWASLIGTPHEPSARGKMLFLEDVGENLYRVDRLVQQIGNAGGFAGVKAILLGTFEACRDQVPGTLPRYPESLSDLKKMVSEPRMWKPLRKTHPTQRLIREIFGEVSSIWKVPVYQGLPVGHGPGYPPFPLGAQYRLTPSGELELLRWSWNR